MFGGEVGNYTTMIAARKSSHGRACDHKTKHCWKIPQIIMKKGT
jgi:hypothetical protein